MDAGNVRRTATTGSHSASARESPFDSAGRRANPAISTCRTSVEIMEIFQNLNDKGLTIVLVTHEHDIAQFAKRVAVFRDGKIRKDDLVLSRLRASEVLKTLPTLED
jgi:hypothetical protein